MEITLHSQSSETSRIEQLPDDVLLHILSFLPTLAVKARTSILSQKWKNLWLYTTCLDFVQATLLPVEQIKISRQRDIEWVDKVIQARNALPGMPSVKVLRIQNQLNKYQSCHIDKWISFATANRIEMLHLEFNASNENTYAPPSQYELSETPWLKTPSGLSNIKCLKSLCLSRVNVTKQFIQFVLSSCPLLEGLSLDSILTYTHLDVSGAPPLQLRRLKIILPDDFALDKLCAPYLTSLYYDSHEFNPQKIDVPMLSDLTIGSRNGKQLLLKYLEPFWSYLRQLEKLELIIAKAQNFTLGQMPKLVKLKYLRISIMDYNEGVDSIFYRVIAFVNACPMLEIFAMEMAYVTKFPHPASIEWQKEKLRELEKSFSFKCLKELRLYGNDRIIIEQEVIRFIIRNAPNLEKLTVVDAPRYDAPPIRPRHLKAMKKKAMKLCQESHLEIEITVWTPKACSYSSTSLARHIF